MSALNRSTSSRKLLNVDTRVLEEALQLANEGKITNKNAWDVKIIESMHDVDTIMDAEGGDAYYQFQRAANIVESGAKVWAHRVEHTHNLTSQVYRRLIRCDNKKEEGDEDVDAADAETNRSTSNATEGENQRPKKKVERTLADSNAELCVKSSDEKHFDIDPLFRATSRKFDQGSAQGLLLNNTRIGPRCNVMLGSDHAVEGSDGVHNNHTEDNSAAGTTEISDQQGVPQVQPHEGANSELPDPSFVIPEPAALPVEPEVFGNDGDDDDGPDVEGGPQMNVDEPSICPEASFAMTADNFLSGTQEIDRIDRLLAANLNVAPVLQDNPDYIPIQNTNDILKAGSALNELVKGATVVEGEEAPKRRKVGIKTVKFAEEHTMHEWVRKIPEAKRNGNPYTAVTPFGKEWLQNEDGHDVDQYTDPQQALCIAGAKGFYVVHEDDNVPNYLQSLDYRSFMQPFCTNAQHWNFCDKRQKSDNVMSGPVQVEDNPVMPIMDDIADNDSDDGIADMGGFGGPSFMTADSVSVALPHGEMELIDAPSTVEVLKVQSVTKPSVVDVGRLRTVMWDHTSDQHESHPTAPIQFSDVVLSMINQHEIPKISKDGTLSTAFFYFSLLFLANEKGLRLEQSDDMSDVKITFT